MGSCCRSCRGRCRVLGVRCQEKRGRRLRQTQFSVVGRWQNLQTDAAVESHVSKTAKRGVPATEGTGLAGVGYGPLLNCPSITSETVATTGRPTPSVISVGMGTGHLLLNSRHWAYEIAIVAMVCVLSIFFAPLAHGPYSAVHGPMTALRSLRNKLTVGALHLAGRAWGVEGTSRARSEFQVVLSGGIAFRR